MLLKKSERVAYEKPGTIAKILLQESSPGDPYYSPGKIGDVILKVERYNPAGLTQHERRRLDKVCPTYCQQRKKAPRDFYNTSLNLADWHMPVLHVECCYSELDGATSLYGCSVVLPRCYCVNQR